MGSGKWSPKLQEGREKQEGLILDYSYVRLVNTVLQSISLSKDLHFHWT